MIKEILVRSSDAFLFLVKPCPAQYEVVVFKGKMWVYTQLLVEISILKIGKDFLETWSINYLHKIHFCLILTDFRSDSLSDTK